jgi:hypothetical protein
MVEYKCNKCLKIFSNKTKYTKHQSRKFPCEKQDKNNKQVNPIESKIGKKKVKHTCIYCNVIFSTNSNMSKHMKTYKVRKQQENQKEELLQKLVEQMNKQNKEMVEMKKVINQNNEEISKLKTQNNKYVQKIGNQENISTLQNTKIENQQNIQ